MDEISGRPGARVLLVVALSMLSCLVLVLVRYGLTGRFSQSYLIWNLVLAAVPVLIARYGTMLASRQTTPKRSRVFAIGSFMVWLVFYPNAPYVFTDFIHVVRRANLGAVALPWLSQADLLWYDIVMNAAFAFIGHYMGLVSMYIMHGAMRAMFGRVAGWSLMVPAILLSGFGIHIGRFSRFDSWDLIMQPVQTVRVISQSLSDPAALLFSTAFAFFIALTYIIFYIVKRADLG